MQITCPSCSHKFDLNDDLLNANIQAKVKGELKLQYDKALADQVAAEKQRLNKEAEKYNQQREALLAEDKAKLQLEIENLKMQASNEQKLIAQNLENQYASKLQFYEEQEKLNKAKIAELQEKEVKILQLEAAAQNQQQQAELNLQKALLEKEQELKNAFLKLAEEEAQTKFGAKVQELEHKLEQQKKLTEESQRKLHQGSMETQGEVQEELIKEKLQRLFPLDTFSDVKKGQRGGDIIHTVRNNRGDECGIILYESKNTTTWQNGWINKLLDDRRELNADMGLIVTKTFPSSVNRVGQQDGIWICGMIELEGTAAMLRDGILKVYEAKQSQENKGDKMVMLYDYLNSNDFKQKWDAIRDGFMRMKASIDKQRNFYAKSLAEQEQIASAILVNANSFLGDIQGISGTGLSDVLMIE
ncbi:MAG: hypothetical protein RL660_3016 [Bacteroidota bacterium]|jgi:hypothetical protein